MRIVERDNSALDRNEIDLDNIPQTHKQIMIPVRNSMLEVQRLGGVVEIDSSKNY